MTTDEPSVPPKSPSTVRPGQARNLLLTVAGFVTMLGIVAGGTFVYFYDRATAIDRSTPEVVVDQFLDAVLVQKNRVQASLFICSEWTVSDAFQKAEPPSDPLVSVSWGGDPRTAITGARATVDIRIVFRVPVGSGFQQVPENWTIQMSDENGWRVCDLSKVELLEP